MDAKPKSAPKNIEAMAAEVYTAATRNPDRAPTIFGRGAERFDRMARDPRNRRAAAQLSGLAQQFSNASAQALGPINDFDELLHEAIDAHRLGAANDLDQIAIQRQVRESTLPPRVSIAPESFNRDTALGRSVRIKWNPTPEEHALGVRQEDTAAFWKGLKYEAQAITVDVGLLDPFNVTPSTDEHAPTARPYAIVEYGTDGMKTQVRFDIGRGVRFTVVGNYVSVRVGMGQVLGQTVPMTVGASLGAFAAPSQAPVFLTEYVEQLSPDEGSALIQVPAHGVQLYPLQSDAPNGSVVLQFFSYGGGGLYSLDYPINTVSALPVPLTGDVGFVKVLNTTGSVARFWIPFELSL